MEQTINNEQANKIKSISEIIKENNDNDLVDCCKKRIRRILQKEELTEQDLNELNTLCNILNCCKGPHHNYNIDSRAINTKEEGEELIGLVMGNKNFEDWHIFRLLLKIKMLETLLK